LDLRNIFIMSLVSKVTLVSATAFSVGIISYVHFKQYSDRELLHRGVLDDIERRQRRKTENLYNLQKQIDLTRDLNVAEERSSGEKT